MQNEIPDFPGGGARLGIARKPVFLPFAFCILHFVFCIRRGKRSDRSLERAPMTKLSYRDAGLDLDVYEQSLAAMVPFLKPTHTPRVLDGFGGFASLFSLDYNSRLFAKNYRRPVLVTCTDGVGSKLKIAGLMNKHDTVGIDLV